ncbi:MAG: N-6 DNA methylase, partial [Terracidiphilus sp.]
MPATYTVADYITDLRAIRSTGSAMAETSYYPPVDRLFNASGQTLDPPVRFSTQLRNSGAGMPDGGFFPQPKRRPRNAEPQPLINPERGAVEIKPADYSLDALTNAPQTLGYLNQYGLVLITNLREFRLLKLVSGQPQTIERYILADSVPDLWTAPLAQFAKHKQLLPDFLARVMLYRAPLAQPKDVAWLLASYAREARARAEDHPLASFDAVKKALQESLGIRFEGEKGEHFFRSTLVQTLFYGIFSAWVLWHRSPAGRIPGAQFDWRLSAYYLRVPVLRKLFGEMADPGALNSIQLQQVLDLAGEALNRTQPAFFDTFREDDAVAYFYEPFLEAFDPQLRKDLGVWYTPKQIVDYMVERVDHLLRTQLNQPLGLASPAVRILDPCCGTGAYLTAVLHRIHRTLLENAGDDTALVPSSLRTAALTRVYGFEIMPAPFVIAHLQIASLLETAHAPLTDEHRAGVYLTNALTGWVPERHPQSAIFREFEKEREDSEHIKQQGTILVILGNPPYNGYAGIAKIDEERDLTTAYREQIPGLPAPQGQGLNDLYIRFFRIAERRIVGDANVHGNDGGCGIMSLISNYSWLDGMSHTTMRDRYLKTFNAIYIDNLNGDKYRTGKTTPDGHPDPSAFSTPQNREGIQVGTAISTFVRTNNTHTRPEVHLRDLWGSAKLAQLQRESRHEAEPCYTDLLPAQALGYPLAQRTHSSAYTNWPLLPELFQVSFPGIKASRDSLVIDIDRDILVSRMQKYCDPDLSDA